VTFTKYIAQEFGRKGITANIVSPGLVEMDQNAHFPAEIKQQYASLTTIGPTGKPQDLANVIAFFASDESGCCVIRSKEIKIPSSPYVR
jgi:3-oxoacyl-[acyl-carrier protein] reductase